MNNMPTVAPSEITMFGHLNGPRKIISNDTMENAAATQYPGNTMRKVSISAR
ncbi:hypothetical protein D3C71_1273310 [compost metagenome]